jgi:hypothetical protein
MNGGIGGIGVLMNPGTQPRPLSSNFLLARDEWGHLVLIDSGGVRHTGVTAIAMFPLSEPERWISLCGVDGRELAFVEDPQQLSEEGRALLREELAHSRFIPVIERIMHVSGNTEPCQWQVETDRGPTQFVLKSEDDVRRLAAEQILILDAHGQRYYIPDLRLLDAKSRRVVEWYV